jgi:SHS2 domain-containing protein
MNNQLHSDVGHRALRQTNDVIVEAWAPSRSGCLEELVRGVVSIFADTRNVAATREVPVEVGAARDEDVVVLLLDDVCYLLNTDGLVVVDVALDEEDDACFDGTFFVVSVAAIDPTGDGPKGISRSDLQFACDGSLWRGRVHVDL